MRYCFTGQVDPALLTEYREHHADVWPEMLQALAEAGWGDYTLHLGEDGLLVGVVQTPEGTTLEQARARVESTTVNALWQSESARFFPAAPPGRPDLSFTVLPTVFDLTSQLERQLERLPEQENTHVRP